MSQISDPKKTLDTERDQGANEIDEAPKGPDHVSPQETPPDGLESQATIKELPAKDHPDPQSPIAKSMFLRRACKAIRNLRITHTGLFVVLILAAILLVVCETFQNRVTIKPITVPPKLEDMGYTPRVAAQHLIANLHDVRKFTERTIDNSKSKEFYYLAGESTEYIDHGVDFVIPVVGLSIKPTAEYLRNLLGLKVTVVTGEILYDDLEHKSISLRLRINGKSVADILKKDNKRKIDQLFQEGAYEVIRNIKPSLYYYSKGNELADRGDYVGASGKYENAIKFDPTFAPAYHNWGLALAEKGDSADAIRKYEEATKLDPAFAPAYHNWGNALAEKGDYAGAIEKYKEAIKFNPQGAMAYGNWGLTLTKRGDYDNAIEKYKKATKLDPTFVHAYRNWGLTLTKKGDYDGAIEKYKEAINFNSKDATVYGSWGLTLATKGDYDGAIEKYKEAINFNSKDAIVYGSWGWALATKGDYDGAIEKYKKATKLDPTFTLAYRNWGNALANIGDCDGAIGKYNKATELDGKSSQPDLGDLCPRSK